MGGPRGTSRDANILDAQARGISDPGKEDRYANVDTETSDKGLRRADFVDAYRAGMILRLTDDSLAIQDIPTLLIRARQMSSAISEGWGPRTSYAHASNLLTLYAHLLDRARASERDRDGALLTTERLRGRIPWSPDRIKHVEEIPEFRAGSIATWNAIVAEGPPPEYDPRRPWNGTHEPKIELIEDRRPRPGMGRGAGYIKLPMGLYAVIRSGSANARLMYRLLKTPEMSEDSEDGRAAILAAVIAQILQHKYSENYFDTTAHEMLRRGSYSPRGVIYANDPAAFKRLYDSGEFKFEVGISFLMNLDDVTGGAVPMKTINLLDAGVDIRKEEARPLWRELYPNNTRIERAYWAWKRKSNALELYDPSSRRPKPGVFYPGNQMFYVADGMFAGDQIWMTRDARIYTVNEREALLEAFRQGVLAAAGMVAVAYMMIALALLAVEGPALVASLGRLISAPATVCQELLMVIRTQPLSVLGRLAVGEGSNMILSGGPEKYLEHFGGADTWVDMFVTVLGFVNPKVFNVPSGAQFAIGNGQIKLLTAGPNAAKTVSVPDVPLKTPPVSGGKSGTLTPDAPVQVPKAPPPPVVTTPLKQRRPAPVDAADSGASAVIHTEPKLKPGADSTPRVKTPDAVQKPKGQSAEVLPPRRGTTDAERGNTPKQRDTDFDAGGGGGSRRGTRPRGAAGQSRQRRPEPPGGKRDITGRKRPGVDRRGSGGGGRGGGGDGGGGRGGGGGSRGGGGGRDRGRVRGKRRPRDERIVFRRGGVRHEITVTPEARRAYDDIPVGNTVVYTVHNNKGEVIYVGITTKTDSRGAVNRLQEHLRDKNGTFIVEANEFRIVGHYSPDQAHQANALEHWLIKTHDTPLYNRDLNTWQTHADYGGNISDRYAARPSRDLVDDVTRGLRPSRRKAVPDFEGNVPPQLGQPIRFGVNSGRAPATGRRPGPTREPGVDPDFDLDLNF